MLTCSNAHHVSGNECIHDTRERVTAEHGLGATHGQVDLFGCCVGLVALDSEALVKIVKG